MHFKQAYYNNFNRCNDSRVGFETMHWPPRFEFEALSRYNNQYFSQSEHENFMSFIYLRHDIINKKAL